MFEDLIICDASPLILLSKIGALDLLTSAARRVMVPRAVWDEAVSRIRTPASIIASRLLRRRSKPFS